jgi:hypothetical protein
MNEKRFSPNYNAFDDLYLPQVVEGLAEEEISGSCENCGNDQTALDTVELVMRILNADPAHYDRAVELLRLTLFNKATKVVQGSGPTIDVSQYWDDLDDAPADPSTSTGEEMDVLLDDNQDMFVEVAVGGADDDIMIVEEVVGGRSAKTVRIDAEMSAATTEKTAPPIEAQNEVVFEAGSAPETYGDTGDGGPALLEFNNEEYVPDTYSSINTLEDLLQAL